jgi:hypothetical protein
MDIINSQIPIILYIQSLGAWLATPMKLLSFLGTEEFFLLVAPAIYWCFDTTLGLRTAFFYY